MSILSAALMIAAAAPFSAEKPSYTLITAPMPARVSGYVQPAPERLPAHRELTVLTYNVHGLPWPITKGRKRAFRQIGGELARMRAEGRAPDIVLIQEGFEDIEDLVGRSGYKYWVKGPRKGVRPDPDQVPTARRFARVRYPVFGEGWGKLTSSGLHVLSDYPIMAVEDAAYRYCAGWDCLANKGVMMVKVEIPGLAQGVDVATTHLNSRGTAAVPFGRSLLAHHLQMEEMNAFILRNRTPGAPLIVGGDFNVRRDPDRYYHKIQARPFTVVSEFCSRPASGCEPAVAADDPEPWLASQDLQAFADGERTSVRPTSAAMVLDDRDGPRLSDHDGYLVRYRLQAELRPLVDTRVATPRRENAPRDLQGALQRVAAGDRVVN